MAIYILTIFSRLYSPNFVIGSMSILMTVNGWLFIIYTGWEKINNFWQKGPKGKKGHIGTQQEEWQPYQLSRLGLALKCASNLILELRSIRHVGAFICFPVKWTHEDGITRIYRIFRRVRQVSLVLTIFLMLF